MKWFLEVFLPSIEKRMNNPKYPNQAIITRNQFDVCARYFQSVQCHSDYGWFTIWEYRTEEAHYQITFRGQYIFLTKTPNEEDPSNKASREAEQQRIKAERIERTKRNPERLEKKIAALKRKIQGRKEEYELDVAEGNEDQARQDLEAIAELEAELTLYTY